MLVLAVDPGVSATGFAALDDGAIVLAGTVRTKKDPTLKPVSSDHARRIQHIARRLKQVVDACKIEVMVAEMPTGGAKSASALGAMARVAGLTATFAELCSLPHVWVSPKQVKLAAAGFEYASKFGVEMGVRQRWPDFAYPKTKVEREHLVDSLAAYMAAESQLEKMTFKPNKKGVA